MVTARAVRRVARRAPDISEENIVSIFRVEEKGKQGRDKKSGSSAQLAWLTPTYFCLFLVLFYQ
jgi:hypothetical protein